MSLNGSITYLDIGLLQPNPFQPRNKLRDEDLAELVESVKMHGILEPLVVAQTPAGYQIIAGERRWRAAGTCKIKQVPVIIKSTTPRGMLELALIENVQRVDLNPIERGQAFVNLQRTFGYSLEAISEKISKSFSYVVNSVRILELPDAIKDGLVRGLISEGHAKTLAGIKDPKEAIRVYRQILAENASVRKAEDLVRDYRSQNSPPVQESSDDEVVKIVTPVQTYNDSQIVKEWQERIQKLVEAKAQLKLSRTNKSTRITIVLKGSPSQTQADLDRILALTSGKKIKSKD